MRLQRLFRYTIAEPVEILAVELTCNVWVLLADVWTKRVLYKGLTLEIIER